MVDQQRQQLVEEIFAQMVRALPSFTRLPVTTYRLQLNRGFGFKDASAIVAYLDSLGISDLYTSPCLRAAAGSLHGYDVVDHRQLNPDLGAPEDYDALAAELSARGMGHLLDFVPNHMAIGPENPLWMDVLENGSSSIYAHVFDIDWVPVKEELRNQVLLPILGDQYGAILERGELRLLFENGAFWITYFEHRFPVAPRQYTQILDHRLEEAQRAAGTVHYEDLLSIITALGNLPPSVETDPSRIAERNREKEAIKRRIIALCEASAPVREHIEGVVREFNGRPGEPRSFDLLDKLLRAQSYRLAYWRVAAEEINYRRFFDINALAAIRMEDPRVFKAAHSLVFRLIAEGKVRGLRIDHPDGLYQPAEYFEQLQEELAVTVCRKLYLERQGSPSSPDEATEAEWAELEPALRARYRGEAARGPQSPLFRPLYVVVEKILANHEGIPAVWAVHGTTGYDFMNAVNSVLVDDRNARALDDLFARFTGLAIDYPELVYQKRRQTMGDSMSSELNMLARRLNRISEQDRRTRDFTLNSLRRALMEVVACFPVYRTYRSRDGEQADDHDRGAIEAAVRWARRRNPTINASIFGFIREVLLGLGNGNITDEARRERLEFVLKLQQFTAPVMAKSVEDTAFYIFNRLVSLNEVGGEPDVFGISVADFHERNQERADLWPGSLMSTSTHDTKRSEDVRARISVLSEIPIEWKKRLAIWSRLNRRFKQVVGDLIAPDRNEELLLYQTLLGAWPFGEVSGEGLEALRGRIQAYMQKAMKEAKVNTSWFNPDEAWEHAVGAFVDALFDPKLSERFWRDFLPFQKKVAAAGAHNALSQLVLKLAGPGAADVYQGNELWDLSLVDPDNRRPVDYELRRGLLAELDARAEADREELGRELYGAMEDGRIKLFVTSQGLRARRGRADLFRSGRYVALRAQGERAGNVIALARRHEEQAAIAIAPRLVAEILDRYSSVTDEHAWTDTFVVVPYEQPGRVYVDVFTGARLELEEREGKVVLPVAKALACFPVMLALREG